MDISVDRLCKIYVGMLPKLSFSYSNFTRLQKAQHPRRGAAPFAGFR